MNVNEPLSPLADPVVAAIFSDVNHAGLAAASLIKAVLAEDDVSIGKVISVTPQKFYKYAANKRGCRVDVNVKTNQNELIIIEVQIYKDVRILERDLMSASLIFHGSVPKGTKAKDLPKVIPKVIAINILEHNIRTDNTDVIQPIKLMYEKAPQTVALNYFSIYNVQLERFREKEHDFTKPLDCWLYSMDYAAKNNLTMKEVLNMVPALQRYAKKDPGFVQFVELYEIAIDDDNVVDEYNKWILTLMWESGVYLGARQEGVEQGLRQGVEQGLRQGVEQGIEQGKFQVALNMLKLNLDTSSISQITGLDIETIKRLSQE